MKFEFRKLKSVWLNVGLVLILTTTDISAQTNVSGQQSNLFDWWHISLFLMVIALAAAVYHRYKNKSAEEVSGTDFKRSSHASKNSGNGFSAETDKQLEWLRKNRKVAQNGKRNGLNGKGAKGRPVSAGSFNSFSTALPIFSFIKLKTARTFDNLPISSDPALLSAIEQVHDEFEEDEEIRALAVRILAAFKTSNSVESLSQVALYDLSSNIRSNALTVLSEFDHESVFETILLACADPTREVRAAAARALFHLTFNRADAWVRITESGDIGRMRQAARAAIEGGLVERSFERLAHQDSKYAYEAFALVILLIRTGETEPVFTALKKHYDPQVRRAILHTLKVSKDKKCLDGLNGLLKEKNITPELQEEVDKTIEEMGFVTV